MQIHFSPIATVFVALLFLSGTVGCRSNGGDWYNPKSYAFTNPFANMSNPFAKDNQAPPFSPDSVANAKPSTDSQPNVSVPKGGYTDETYANRAGSAGMTASNSAPAQWGQQSPMAQQGSPNALGGYTDPEPSQYAPYSDYARHNATPASSQYAPSQNPYLYQPEAGQHANSQTPSGNDYMQPNYQATSVHAAQQPASGIQTGAYGAPVQQGSYAPFGTAPQADPYTATQYPGVPAQSPVLGYEQSAPSAPVGLGYPSEYAPATSPYQYQPPAIGGGYSASY
jgi:hypothetical protein